MMKDVVLQERIVIADSEAVHPIVDEFKARIARRVAEEVYAVYVVHIPESSVHIEEQVEHSDSMNEVRVNLKAYVTGVEIERMKYGAAHPASTTMRPFDPAWEKAMFYTMPPTFDAMVPVTYADVEVLHAMLDEALPNWKEVYDNVKKGDEDAKAKHESFKADVRDRWFSEWAKLAPAHTGSSKKN